MTILTSLYKLRCQNKKALKENVRARISELEKNATKVCVINTTKELDLKIVAMFDTCIKRRIKAIKKLKDKDVLSIIAECEEELAVKDAAIEKLENI